MFQNVFTDGSEGTCIMLTVVVLSGGDELAKGLVLCLSFAGRR
jgi:hypothetical protein